MSERTGNGLDATLAGYLAGEFRFVSRRSAMQRLTRIVFGAVGVAIGSRVLPFTVPDAEAALSWKLCGLHGYECKGTCVGGTLSTGFGRAWQVCCEDPSCHKWFCCVYTDQCGKRTPDWGRGCGGNGDLNTTAWCGERPARVPYICTQATCAGGAGAKDAASCKCSADDITGC
jgi:hypothetical protein